MGECGEGLGWDRDEGWRGDWSGIFPDRSRPSLLSRVPGHHRQFPGQAYALAWAERARELGLSAWVEDAVRPVGMCRCDPPGPQF